MSPSARPIAVFDSGIGGLSVLRALRAALPAEDFVYFADTAYAPYGEQDSGYVIERSHVAADILLRDQGAKALVVACNTATAAAIEALRQRFPQTPVVGIEPALKPAAGLSRTGHVGVLATRGTLQSPRFQALLQTYADRARFDCLACDGLADAIEQIAAGASEAKMLALCQEYTQALGRYGAGPGDIDTLVLGCTHYALVDAPLQRLVGPGVRLLEPGEAVARRTRDVLHDAGLLHAHTQAGRIRLLSSGDLPALQQAASRWLPGWSAA